MPKSARRSTRPSETPASDDGYSMEQVTAMVEGGLRRPAAPSHDELAIVYGKIARGSMPWVSGDGVGQFLNAVDKLSARCDPTLPPVSVFDDRQKLKEHLQRMVAALQLKPEPSHVPSSPRKRPSSRTSSRPPSSLSNASSPPTTPSKQRKSKATKGRVDRSASDTASATAADVEDLLQAQMLLVMYPGIKAPFSTPGVLAQLESDASGRHVRARAGRSPTNPLAAYLVRLSNLDDGEASQQFWTSPLSDDFPLKLGGDGQWAPK